MELRFNFASPVGTFERQMNTMHGSFFLVHTTVFLLLSCAPNPLSCTRRINSTTPPPPPSITPPKLPLSSTSATDNAPFFPLYPPAPPPPPPATFATYPADISALVLPRSSKPKTNSRKLLIPAISALISAAAVAGIIFFLYRRRRGQHGHFLHDNKSLISDNSHVEYSPPNIVTRNASNKLSVNAISSEVLYLGNVVNSHGLDDGPSHPPKDPGSDATDSPELRPLPPLSNHQSSKQNCDVRSVTEEAEDDDEFYSPMASLAGTEVSSRVRSSGSGQISKSQVSATRNNVSSTCSGSTSSSGSPERSVSVTISPPVSSSPWRSETWNLNSPSDQNPQSPSLSLASTSPDRSLTNNRCESLRIFSFLNRSLRFPRISSASTSPDRCLAKTPDAFAGSSFYSSASTSPDGVFEKTLEASSKLNDFNRNVQSVLLSSSSISPEREFSKDPDEYPKDLNLSGQNLHSRTSPGLKQSLSAPPPHPPPPPPPPPPPLPGQPRTGTKIMELPPLTRPSQPFVLRNPGKRRCLSELPPSSSELQEPSKPKLKPLHWDKLRASSSRKTAWDRLRSSSFRLNEEMIETLFIDSKPKQTSAGFDGPMLNQDYRILDPKKSQNIAILLRALNVTTKEVCEALLNGDADALGTELLESLSRMAPNEKEIQQLKEYEDDSPVKLGPAEKFLKAVLDVPLAFERVDALLFVANFESEIQYLKTSFGILQTASEELKTSRMFLKLLEAVLKTGNRMNVGTNRGDAHAFKLDTLLKLVDVKGADGKTTLLHFVAQEIVRSEAARLSDTSHVLNSEEDAQSRKLGLQVICNLSSELVNVKKSAAMDSDVLSSDVRKLQEGIVKIKEVLQQRENMGSDEKIWKKFSESMNQFLKMAEEEMTKLQTQEGSALSAVKEVTEYFHGDLAKEEAHPFRIFVVVKDFLTVLDRVCKEIGIMNERTNLNPAYKFQFQ